jgi:hypothetical protein
LQKSQIHGDKKKLRVRAQPSPADFRLIKKRTHSATESPTTVAVALDALANAAAANPAHDEEVELVTLAEVALLLPPAGIQKAKARRRTYPFQTYDPEENVTKALRVRNQPFHAAHASARQTK